MKARIAIATAILLLLLAGAVKLIIPRGDVATGEAACAAAPAAYPPDLAERLARVQGVLLTVGADAEPPPGLCWQDAAGEEEPGDPAARKGGTVRLSNAGPYPANFLHFGSTMPQFFHANLFGNLEIRLVERHPASGASIPGTARQWAVAGNTVFFRLNPAARYSNGRPLRAADYVLGALLRLECGCAEGDAIRAAVESVAAAGDTTLIVTLRHETHRAEQAAARLLHPAEPGFYAEFGGDYRERYAQRIPPTTAAYTVARTQRGRMVELAHVKDWWAADEKFYRHRFNAERIQHHFLNDEAQVWELFLRGGLDALQTRNTAAWERHRDDAPERILFRDFTADCPAPPYGIALNARTVQPLALRRGLMHAMDMDTAVARIFHGDAERLHSFTTGYRGISPRDTPEYRHDPAAARERFAQAGFTAQGPDGILRRADGTRLSVRLAYTPSDKVGTLVNTLVQSARACGAEIVPEPLPWQDIARMMQEGRHEMVFWATAAGGDAPDYAGIFGRDAEGFDAPFHADDAALQRLVEEFAATADRAACAARIDRRVYELAVWLPAWRENRVHLAHHPRVHFPDCPACRFSTPEPYDVMEAHLFWLDDEN
ncbi:MAG: ABC transporter substrate-binding protein [Akkermansia sp.]|nr:ABC transporter substrate-binding protein [Akkermansia sp.]